ncbi:hypothetical protein, partial [Gramella jeungdoensis]|uniref:hypothetical protein n=1 Tax=Gramella jeungdoensis TaxID=708091 RepID=UPI001305007D
NIISILGFNKTLSQIPGVSCSSAYDESSTVLLSTNPVKVQRYRNANLTFTVINDINRDYISRGLLVGITPGNTVVHTWEFNIPVNNKDAQINMAFPLGDLVDVFDNMGPDQDGVQFYMLLRSADMPSSNGLAISRFTIYDTPQDSEITFQDFPFKSLNSGSSSFPRLLAYRFRAYESVYNAYYRDIRNNPFVV